MFVGINLQDHRMFDTILKTTMELVTLNYKVPNFTLKVVIVLFWYIIFLISLCRLTTEFQSEKMQESIWPSTQLAENSIYEDNSEHIIQIRMIELSNFTYNV